MNLFHFLKSLSLIFMMFYNFYCITQSYNEDFLFSTLCNFCYIVPEYITIQLRGFLYDDDKLLSYQPQDLVGRPHGRTDFRQSGGAWWTSHSGRPCRVFHQDWTYSSWPARGYQPSAATWKFRIQVSQNLMKYLR